MKKNRCWWCPEWRTRRWWCWSRMVRDEGDEDRANEMLWSWCWPREETGEKLKPSIAEKREDMLPTWREKKMVKWWSTDGDGWKQKRRGWWGRDSSREEGHCTEEKRRKFSGERKKEIQKVNWPWLFYNHKNSLLININYFKFLSSTTLEIKIYNLK